MIIFNQMSEKCFWSNRGYSILILGKQPSRTDIYFISVKRGEQYIGLMPIHVDCLKNEVMNSIGPQKSFINQEALLEQLQMYYEFCPHGSFFTCSIYDALEIFSRSGLNQTPLMIPANKENIERVKNANLLKG